MPTIAVSASQEAIDEVLEDFEENFKRLEELYTRFVEILRVTKPEKLQQHTESAYGESRKGKVWTGVSSGHTLGNALWPDSNDSQPVLQDAWRAGAIQSGESYVSRLAVNVVSLVRHCMRRWIR